MLAARARIVAAALPLFLFAATAHAQGMCMGMGMNCAPQWAPSGPTPVFDFNPEADGSINTGLTGYSFTRATTATTVTESGGVYTLSSVASGTPRYAEHPTFGTGYWAEPVATNLCLQSEDVTTTWTTQASATANVIAAPDGTTTADGLYANGSTLRRREQAITTVISTVYTFSTFVKLGTSGNNTWIAIGDRQGGGIEGTSGVWFNVSAGTKGTDASDGGTIEDWGNGWYRISTTFDATTTSTNASMIVCNGDFVTTSTSSSSYDLAVWGMQFETGPVATSYIPTTISSATRNDDALTYSWTGDDSPVSLVIDRYLQNADTFEVELALTDGGISNRYKLDHNVVPGQYRFRVDDGGVNQALVTATPTPTGDHIRAGSADTNTVKLYLDGSEVGTEDTSATMPSGLDTIDIGHEGGLTQPSLVIRSVKIYDVPGVKE